jgi:hypothetical protein
VQVTTIPNNADLCSGATPVHVSEIANSQIERASFQCMHLLQYFLWLDRIIRVQKLEILSRGSPHPGVAGGRGATILLSKISKVKLLIVNMLRPLIRDSLCIVSRSIVNHDNLDWAVSLKQNGIECPNNGTTPVVGRDDH